MTSVQQIAPGMRLTTTVIGKRDYQDRAVSWLQKMNGRGAIRAPTGAGKTIITISYLNKIKYNRVLILVPRNTGQLAWMEKLHLLNLAKGDKIVVMRKLAKAKRAKIWKDLNLGKVVITTYKTAYNDRASIISEDAGFDVVIADESHEMRNRNTNSAKALKAIARRKKVIFLSASQQNKGPHNWWSVLNILSPRVFPSYWDFVNRYMVTYQGEHGKEILGVRKSKLYELQMRLSGFVFSIPRSEVSKWVPKSVRQVLPVECDEKIKRIYWTLHDKMIAELPTGRPLMAPNVLSKTIRLRQLLACPEIIHPALGPSSGLLSIIDHMETNGSHAVIFCEFVDAFEHWERVLTKNKYKVFTIRGGMSPSEQSEVTLQFSRLKDSKHKSVMLISIKAAESFDLLTPITGYFLGFSWDQWVNLQAEGRLTRGDKPFCNFFYVVHDLPIEPYMVDVLDINTKTVNLTSNDLCAALSNQHL